MKRGRSTSGFTLLETLVALVLLAAGLAALMELLSGSLRLSGGARDLTAATVYASQRLEEALLAPVYEEGTETGTFGEKYRWVTRTTFPPESEGEKIRPVRIEVSVSWDDAGTTRAVDLAATRWEARDAVSGG